jgi:hypothetical protein
MKTYTLEDIQTAYKEYESINVLRVLKDGKWRTEVLDGRPRGNFEGTSAQVVKLSKVIDFPEYLEDMWTK